MNEMYNVTNVEKPNFLKYVFNTDQENKNKIMNMVQYALMAIVPILIILKSIKHVFPQEDESKGNFEILAESVGQIVLIILSIWFTNRIINFFPTYSGEAYSSFNEISFIIPFLIILSTMQTKLGSKLNILMDRVIKLWDGQMGTNNNNNNISIQQTHPIIEQELQHKQRQKQQYQQPQHTQQPANIKMNNYNESQLLPSDKQLSAIPNIETPDFNQMYQNSQQQSNQQNNFNNSNIQASNDSLDMMFGGSAW